GEPECAHRGVAVMQAGAVDFLRLPTELGRLASLLDALTRRPRSEGCAKGTLAGSRRKAASVNPVFRVVAPQMVGLMEQVARVAPQDPTLLFTGETGTGKPRLVRLVHDLSPRRAEPFLVVDCGSLSPSLIESEMFGHVRGAFTGADRDRPGKFAAA